MTEEAYVLTPSALAALRNWSAPSAVHASNQRTAAKDIDDTGEAVSLVFRLSGIGNPPAEASGKVKNALDYTKVASSCASHVEYRPTITVTMSTKITASLSNLTTKSHLPDLSSYRSSTDLST
mgnify:CR=1 FL=1